jgi:hypothetical protein
MAPDPDREVVDAAGRLLRARFGRRARLASTDELRSSRRTSVYRAAVDTSAAGAPASVIVKHHRLPELHRNDYFFSEAAALDFLGGLTSAPIAPRLYGVDRRRRVLVLEDLGTGVSLAELLMGNDRAAAEAGLLAYARALGRLHAATAGRADDFRRVSRAAGAPLDFIERDQARIRRDITLIAESLTGIEFEWTPALVDEVGRVAATLISPGPFLVLSHDDSCPDNNRLLDGEMRFFDFEFAGFRHALLDAVYPRVPFATCWCVNCLPEPVLLDVDRAYRDELARGVPEANDDATYYRAAVEAHAFWLLTTMRRPTGLRDPEMGLFSEALAADRTWGTATIRQRIIHRLEAFAGFAYRHHHLEAIASFASHLAEVLRARWPFVPDLPLFPAFRDPSSP